MSIFDNIFGDLLANFSEWIKIEDDQCPYTIQDFPYETGVDELKTIPHCWRCVTINDCWFKNEKDKKPQELEISNPILNLFLEMNNQNGLYHPNCHCKKIAIDNPTTNDIELIILPGKIDDFFTRKIELAASWGYKESDKEIFRKRYEFLVRQAFINGNYKEFKHDKFGFQISIYISMPGNNEKSGKYYNRQAGFTIFPNGTLKNNTIFGGKW